VQDPWNSTPAWGYPFVQTNLANTPGAKTLIDQGFAAQVLGLGAYTFINDQLYLEVAGYQTLNPGALNSLGVSPLNTQPINGIAPYFRAAYEKQWGRHILEIGTFGFFAETGLSIANFVPGVGTNRFTDIGFDSQYQYQGDGYWVTVRATYLHEKQNLPASVAAGLAGNLNNTLRAQAALTYGTDGKIVLTGGYFNTWGTADPILFAGNRTFLPNSDASSPRSPTSSSARTTPRNCGRGSIPGSACSTSPTTSSTALRSTSTTWGRTPATTTRCWSISGRRSSQRAPCRKHPRRPGRIASALRPGDRSHEDFQERRRTRCWSRSLKLK
jgi:hypothetical protein